MSDKVRYVEESHEVTPLSARAAFTAKSVNEEARTVEVTWTTGEKVLRYDWEIGPFYEELSLDKSAVRMSRLQSGTAPFLASHDSYSLDSVLGVVEQADLGKARIRFAKDDPGADVAWNKVRQGILGNVSVGYRIHKMELVETGDAKIPTYRAVDWEPMEISLVGIGADSQAKVRSDPTKNTCVFVNRAAAHPEKQVMPDETPKPAAPAVDPAQIRAEERARSTEITRACRSLGLDEKFGADLIEKGTPLAEAHKLMIDARAEQSDKEGPSAAAVAQGGSVQFEVVRTEKEKFLEQVTEGIAARVGAIREAGDLSKTATGTHARKLKEFELRENEFTGKHLVDVAEIVLQRSGVKIPKHANKREILALAFRSANYATTSDFTGVLENVMHKSMRAPYATQLYTWNRWIATTTVTDFRPHLRFMPSTIPGTLPVVVEHGEYRNLVIPDSPRLPITVRKYGGIIGFSWEALVNDDMGALTETANSFGKTAARTVEKAAYDLINLNTGAGPTLADGNPFFHTSRGNIATGTALSVAAIDADRTAMRQQLDAGGDYIDLDPKIALVSLGIATQLGVINESVWNNDSTKFQQPNMVKGQFTDIVTSPRLGGTLRRYYFDPSKQAFVAAFLEGEEGPTFDREEGFRIDGTQWKVRIVFDINPFDPKLGFYNPGA